MSLNQKMKEDLVVINTAKLLITIIKKEKNENEIKNISFIT